MVIVRLITRKYLYSRPPSTLAPSFFQMRKVSLVLVQGKRGSFKSVTLPSKMLDSVLQKVSQALVLEVAWIKTALIG